MSRLNLDTDAEFILQLLNEQGFLRFIGDKGVHNIDDARRYLSTGPITSYAKYGFGLYLVQLKESLAKVGMCGLLKRETLEDVDIGFAFLEEYWNRGYAFESAEAVLAYGRRQFKLDRVVAITDPQNDASARVLEKIGLKFERLINNADGTRLKLFA